MSVEFNDDDRALLEAKLGETGSKVFSLLRAVSRGAGDVELANEAADEILSFEAQQEAEVEALLNSAESVVDSDEIDE